MCGSISLNPILGFLIYVSSSLLGIQQNVKLRFKGPSRSAYSENRITVFCAPATELMRLVDEDLKQYNCTVHHRTLSAGEAVSPEINERWRAASELDISEAYGRTDVLMAVLNYPGEEVRSGSMGRPSPGSMVDIIGPNWERSDVGEEGDLAVMTPKSQPMLGNWKDPERTQACSQTVRKTAGMYSANWDRGIRITTSGTRAERMM